MAGNAAQIHALDKVSSEDVVEQLERLQEINIQLQGIAALRNADVAKELKITDAQKKELEEVQAGMMEKMREGMRELFTSGGGREGMREKIEKMRADMEGDVLATNRKMLRLCERLGFSRRRSPEDAGVVIVSRPL